ncbi:MAG: DUF4276 family protein [Fibrobacterota bacterium]|nr:DUF4276 family protein [Fibrobacterota bacterium]
MKQALRHLLPNYFPDFRENEHWIVIAHQGKSDLERSYPRKMKTWQEPGARFLILRDNDGSDCRTLKAKLIEKVPANSQGYLIRIVCQELESWLLGDLEALGLAYPDAMRKDQFKFLAKRDPDDLTNASKLVEQLTGTGSKTIRATEIAKNMRTAENRSVSFKIFLSGVTHLLAG